ncbi:MAG: hypothetical protein IPI58_04975 [Alphaproteobacteria bacterium]|nr:MAG: hypothetical protein IPI58_04975 [Alphaproteobacteria bacterium]
MVDWLFPLIGGLGLGSLLKGIVDHLLAAKSKSNDRTYQEKKDSYMGFLQAIAESTYEPSLQKTTMAGLAKARCDLFGSREVRDRINEYQVQKDNRESILSEMIIAMRKDLGF